VSARVVRPVLRWHGGKFKLRDWIVSYLPPHRLYIEPYGGAASILLAKPRSFGEIYNDLDGDVVRLFRVLRDPERAERLADLLRLTPFAREEYEIAQAAELAEVHDDLEAARMLVLRSFMGHGSDSSVGRPTGFRASSWGSNRAAPRDWQNYPSSLRAITERLQGVVIESRPAIEVMLRHDRPEALHYVAPPYLHTTRSRIRGYRHEMTREDHVALAEVLRELRGTVVLSGYPSVLYDRDLYPDWHRIQRGTFADGAQERTEVLWSNRHLHPLFGLLDGGGGKSTFQEEL
jgi:DNA adenine methylase